MCRVIFQVRLRSDQQFAHQTLRPFLKMCIRIFVPLPRNMSTLMSPVSCSGILKQFPTKLWFASHLLHGVTTWTPSFFFHGSLKVTPAVFPAKYLHYNSPGMCVCLSVCPCVLKFATHTGVSKEISIGVNVV